MTTNSKHSRFAFPFFRKMSNAYLLLFCMCCIGLSFAFMGDSLYGKVTAVMSATQMRFDYDSGWYNIRLIGIDVPGKAADSATQFVSRMILNKKARIRFEGRTSENEMLVRLFTDDSTKGIKEVGIELLRSGLALRKRGVDFKYGELAAAESEARRGKRGIWATQK
jgi:endonuclease YncB( thermonuclease family)